MYLQAMQVDPNDATFRTNLAHVAGRLGRPVPAEAAATPRPQTEIGGS
jgi:hypothetical protein